MIDCPTCQGNGEEVCHRCAGQGTVEGQVCEVCAGTGYVVCRVCGGVGALEEAI